MLPAGPLWRSKTSAIVFPFGLLGLGFRHSPILTAKDPINARVLPGAPWVARAAAPGQRLPSARFLAPAASKCNIGALID